MEDFVPYELLCKLREKGYKCKDKRFEGYIYDVLKWLREEKKIHIIVEIADCGWYYTIYPNIRWEDGKLKSDKYIMSFKNKSSFELAALAGVEYCLDNLI